jgi:hypothetical protein
MEALAKYVYNPKSVEHVCNKQFETKGEVLKQNINKHEIKE